MPGGYFFVIHQSAGVKMDWRWRFHGPNSRIVAVSGESYATKEECVEAVSALAGLSAQPEIHFAEAPLRAT